MNFNRKLIYGLQELNDINKDRQMSKIQLYSTLLDYNAFQENLPIKFIVKTLIEREKWNPLIRLINKKAKEEIKKWKIDINNTFGFHNHLLEELIFSIKMVNDWNDEWNPTNPFDNIYFAGVPICGSTYTFHENLRKQGFRPTYDINYLEGPLYDISSCSIYFEESKRYEPVWNVHIVLPSNLMESACKKFYNDLIKDEAGRRLFDHNLSEIEKYMFDYYYKFEGHVIKIQDPWGHGCMIESPCCDGDSNIYLEYKER